MAGRIEKRLEQYDIKLPPPVGALANYVPWTKCGPLVFIAGQGPFLNGELHYNGRCGEGLSIEDAKAAARIVGLNILAQLKAACAGDLDRVVRCVKLGGFVNAAPDFTAHPAVINGASDLMIEVFGDAGRHTRFAVGMTMLPMSTSVEIDAIFAIKER